MNCQTQDIDQEIFLEMKTSNEVCLFSTKTTPLKFDRWRARVEISSRQNYFLHVSHLSYWMDSAFS